MGAAAAAHASSEDEEAIKNILHKGCETWVSGANAGAEVALYLPEVTVFDVAPPLRKNHEQVVAFNLQLRDNTDGKPTCIYEDIRPVILTPEYAYSEAIYYAAGTMKDGRVFRFRARSTDIWKKVDGTWRVMHEHNSVPVDVMAGTAELTAQP
jgi:ketosteroid isomerase-like protein